MKNECRIELVEPAKAKLKSQEGGQSEPEVNPVSLPASLIEKTEGLLRNSDIVLDDRIMRIFKVSVMINVTFLKAERKFPEQDFKGGMVLDGGKIQAVIMRAGCGIGTGCLQFSSVQSLGRVWLFATP